MADSPIVNFACVDADLWRGARPDAASWAWLAQRGCRTAINLEWEESDNPAPSIVGVRLPDWEPLPLVASIIEDGHIRSFLAAVRGAAKPVFVHCHSGENRTGVAVAAYRLIEKSEPLVEVLADMASFNGVWLTVDETYVRSLAARVAAFRA